jgi:site-specific DNA-methyltransferase (adenine-specific)
MRRPKIGVLITLEPPSKPMLTTAVDAGFYKSKHFADKVPHIQILTIEELLQGKRIDFPHHPTGDFQESSESQGLF